MYVEQFALFKTLNIGVRIMHACHVRNCDLFLCIFVRVFIFFRDLYDCSFTGYMCCKVI